MHLGTSKQKLILGLAGLFTSFYLNYILLLIELRGWLALTQRQETHSGAHPNSSMGKISIGWKCVYRISSAEPRDLCNY